MIWVDEKLHGKLSHLSYLSKMFFFSCIFHETICLYLGEKKL